MLPVPMALSHKASLPLQEMCESERQRHPEKKQRDIRREKKEIVLMGCVGGCLTLVKRALFLCG